MTLNPAEPDSGIVFQRTDLVNGSGEAARVSASNRNVRESAMCTTIGNQAGTTVATIEHLMAAFFGCEVDNAVIELDAAEVPIMDGSASPFVFLIEQAGLARQGAPRRAIRLLRRIEVADGDSHAILTPADSFGVSFDIDFESPAVARQRCVFSPLDGAFKAEICRARTFGFAEQVETLRARGLIRGGSLENAVVVSGDRVLNEDGLRFDDEFARHKVLDSMGDLYLAGAPLLAHFEGVCSGHRLNHRLVRALLADPSAWHYVELDDGAGLPHQEDTHLNLTAAASA